MTFKYLTRAAFAVALAAGISVAGRSVAETVRVASAVPVDAAVARITAAVEEAGAHVFAVVDYAEGAATAGQTIRPTTLVIFGSPRIGAAALGIGQTMGLFLPLRILAFEDAGGEVWLLYPDPADAAVEHGIPADHPAVERMQGALRKMAAAAVAE